MDFIFRTDIIFNLWLLVTLQTALSVDAVTSTEISADGPGR